MACSINAMLGATGKLPFDSHSPATAARLNASPSSPRQDKPSPQSCGNILYATLTVVRVLVWTVLAIIPASSKHPGGSARPFVLCSTQNTLREFFRSLKLQWRGLPVRVGWDRMSPTHCREWQFAAFNSCLCGTTGMSFFNNFSRSKRA